MEIFENKLLMESNISGYFCRSNAPDINSSPTKISPNAASAKPTDLILSVLENIVMKMPTAARQRKNIVKSKLPSESTQAVSVVPIFAPMMIEVA